MSEIALAICILSLVAILGLWIGNWRIYGVGLGIGGVLFGGIAVGHFAKQYGLEVNLHTLEFIREFGLILFVYTIGIQVGPGFFSSLRTSGLKLNAFAALLVVLGCIVAVVLHKLLGIPLPVILGTYSGAVTNTPSLGAGQQMLTELGADANVMTLSYAVAYPFGICGILLSMWLIKLVFRINVESENRLYQQQSGVGRTNLQTMNVEVRNANLQGLAMQEIPDLEEGDVVCSRLKRGEELMVPKPDTIVQLGDLLHLVGDKKALRKVRLVIGEEVATSLSTQGTDMRVERVVVTNEKVLGKTIGELELKSKFDVVVSRLNRAGVELVPNSSSSLQFGDILNLVGRPEAINSVAGLVGNAQHKLQQVQMLPVFLGIGLGVIVGSIPFYIPGFSAALKLGLAGGPLVVALILSRIGSIGKLYWFMPPSANLALREIGIVLFLSVVGLKSGGDFVTTLVDGDGLLWMWCGVAITLIPLLIAGFLARMLGKINYLSLCGLLAGSMTDPPALAFANAMHPTSDAAALSYATVYPMVMFLRIISPQLLVILLWTSGG
ncbi:MAG: putative transporter [Gammaproteobacteria bacterium]|uniref:Putative transport protein n=1 Tax=Tolumonas osonensis TaxID=675874 RepID=A0A841GDA6_9GAMM|nr:putative transporter [Tolumonas osonensis]MBB6055929.1 putative transport protein [Tolumonas osonensis]NCB59819.1 putative transporter [Gammaproteobacteria bacterium]